MIELAQIYTKIQHVNNFSDFNFTQLQLIAYFCRNSKLMYRKLSFLPDEEPNDLIRRYEAFISRKTGAGYFDVEEMEQIVDYYLRIGRTKEGKKALEFGFRLHPGSPGLLTKRAKIYLASDDVQKAFQILSANVNPHDYEVNLLLIDSLVRLGRTTEALTMADNLLGEEVQELDAVCLDLAYIFMGNFDIDTAYQFITKGIAFNPLNKDLLFELAFCQEQTGKVSEATTTYNKILKLDPYSAEAWFNMGQMHYALNEYRLAIDAYEYALVIRPNDSLTVQQKANCHFQLTEYREAIEEYQLYSTLAAAPHWQTWLFIGECYERLEQYNDAIQYYTQSLKEQPENFEALTGIAICLMDQDKFEDSLPFIHRALELQNESAEGWVYLAEALIGTDKVDEALQAYLHSIRLDPEQPETYMAIGNICMDREEFKLALEYYRQALDLDDESDLQNIHLFMAIAFYKTGFRQEALLSLDKAMDESMDALKLFREICPESDF